MWKGLGLAELMQPKGHQSKCICYFCVTDQSIQQDNLQVGGFILAYDFRGSQIIMADMMVSLYCQLDED